MYEATIRCEDEEVLEAIAKMGKELGFSVSNFKDDRENINGVPVRRGDPSVEIEPLNGVFAYVDARELRTCLSSRNS